MVGNVWELCLEPSESLPVVRGGAWNTPASEVRPDARRKFDMDAWLKRDPKQPLRAWWLTDAPFVGFRIVRLADDKATAEERAAAVKQIEIRDLKLVDQGKKPHFIARVTGEILYKGKRPLDEVEVTVFYVDEGKPMMKDPREKPTFMKCWPALANGRSRAPLAENETRRFEVEVPHPFMEAGMLDINQVGAKVTRVHFK
jgi:hypothetical protein